MQKKENTVLLQISICPVYSFRYVTALSDPIFTNRLETWSFFRTQFKSQFSITDLWYFLAKGNFSPHDKNFLDQ